MYAKQYTRPREWTAALLLLLLPRLYGQETREAQVREQIGEVLGKPVYQDEIRTGNGVLLRDELHRLFGHPVWDEYRQARKREIEPTAAEIDAAHDFFTRKHRERMLHEEAELRAELETLEKQLAPASQPDAERRDWEIKRTVLEHRLRPPDRSFAEYMVARWKFERHLYDRYGGGRILWQQAGLEAFDATRKCLESFEQGGKFKIVDPRLREVFYEYWTTMQHGSFLTGDKEEVRAQFLEPEWAPASSPAK